MSTKAIHEALDWLENYLGNNPEAQDARRRARLEVHAIDKGERLVREQVESLLEECRKRAVLYPEDVIDGLERIKRIIKEQ